MVCGGNLTIECFKWVTFRVTCFVWHLMFNRIGCNLALRGVSLSSSSFLFLFEGQGRYGACVFQVSNSYNRKACLTVFDSMRDGKSYE